MRVVTGSEFERMVNRLRRRFRLVDSDIRLLAAELELGRRPQDERLQNMGEMTIYKARLRNTSARRGARGGFRVVYRIMEDGTIILLLLIWSKSDSSDLPDSEIRRVASKYSQYSNDL